MSDLYISLLSTYQRIPAFELILGMRSDSNQTEWVTNVSCTSCNVSQFGQYSNIEYMSNLNSIFQVMCLYRNEPICSFLKINSASGNLISISKMDYGRPADFLFGWCLNLESDGNSTLFALMVFGNT